MYRPAAIAGAALFALGAAIFLWKVVALGVPVLPQQAENLWRVELETHARGAGRGSVTVAIPSADAHQLLHDESVAADGLLFGVRTRGDQRLGVWRGVLEGQRLLTYRFRVQLRSAQYYLEAAPEPAIGEHLAAGSELPVRAPEVSETLAALRLEMGDDVPGAMRALFSFVSDEIETVEDESDDVLLALATRESSSIGKARLLATLLRGSGIPARLGVGLRLSKPRQQRELRWVEAWSKDGGWIALFPSLGVMGDLPDDLLVMGRDRTHLVAATGVDALAFRHRVSRERFDTEEVAALMAPSSPVFAWASLYRLPLATQVTLQLLLVMPIALLVVALFRNLIGISTFGTFLPALIALSLRDAGLVLGLLMVGSVILLGAGARLWFDRLHLLFVPRLCVVLCLVILLIVLMALLGYEFDLRGLLTGTLFPIVILAILIERFSVTAAEEGFGQALFLLGNSAIVAACAYPIFRWHAASHLFFGFPELVFCVMGVLVWIGGYTGYRLSELVRFRHFLVATRA